jgi:hypothetical protein
VLQDTGGTGGEGQLDRDSGEKRAKLARILGEPHFCPVFASG